MIFVSDEISAKYPRNLLRIKKMNSEKNGPYSKLKNTKAQSQFYLGDMVTRSIKWEIGAISGRLPDNPGEMA